MRSADGSHKIIDLGTARSVDQRASDTSQGESDPHLAASLATVTAPQIRFAGTPVYASPGDCLFRRTADLCPLLFPTSELGRCRGSTGRNQYD